MGMVTKSEVLCERSSEGFIVVEVPHRAVDGVTTVVEVGTMQSPVTEPHSPRFTYPGPPVSDVPAKETLDGTPFLEKTPKPRGDSGIHWAPSVLKGPAVCSHRDGRALRVWVRFPYSQGLMEHPIHRRKVPHNST